ncbi:PDH1 [Sanghuangporus weigelae]
MRSYYIFAACVFALLQTGLPALAAPPPSKPSAVNVVTAATPHVPRAGIPGIPSILPGIGSSNSTSSGDATTTTSTVTSIITETTTTTTITTATQTSTATSSVATAVNGAALVLPIKRQEAPTIAVIQGLEVAHADPTGMTTTYFGSCLCEGIQFEIKGEPSVITRCHCFNCRKQTGCAFQPNLVFPDAAIRFTKGEEKREVYRDAAQTSGNIGYRHFCKTCGSHLFVSYRPDTGSISAYSEQAGEGMAAVFYSALDYKVRGADSGEEQVKEKIEDPPALEFHVKDRLKWVQPLEGAAQFWTKPVWPSWLARRERRWSNQTLRKEREYRPEPEVRVPDWALPGFLYGPAPNHLGLVPPPSQLVHLGSLLERVRIEEMLSLSRVPKASLLSSARRFGRVPGVSPAACSASLHASSRTRPLSPAASSPLSSLQNPARIAGTRGMAAESAERPDPDKVLIDIADYIHNYTDYSPLAIETARLCLIDTIGCGLEGLRFEHCRRLLGPVVEGTVVPNGTKVPGTNYQLDPVRGAFNIGTMIRWLDFNDCFLAAEWGHPSDNLGAILAVADHLTRSRQAHLTVLDLVKGMIQAHEIQGCIALLNSFNRVGLDHVVLVKVASAAVVSRLLGLSRQQTIDVVSQAWVDGQSLRTYRHAPNTGSRKSWAAGDACMRAVHLAYLVQRGEMGLPSVLAAKGWGFYDVLFKGHPFDFARPYGNYIMENVLFKISYPAEFHAQTAVEASLILHEQLEARGLSSDDIRSIQVRTQEAAMRIINKKGKLNNFADRDHDINYMIAYPLIFGELTSESYSDEAAADPRIDELRAKITCVQDTQFSQDYHDPDKRSIGNALTVTLNDGTILDEVVVEYPVGHKRRRAEGTPLLMRKFERHISHHFDDARKKQILEIVSDTEKFYKLPVDKFTDLFVKA